MSLATTAIPHNVVTTRSHFCHFCGLFLYARNKAQIIVVTFLHNRVFQINALARTWYKPRDMSALEHVAQGRVLWLEANTHDIVSISIVNVHQATAKWHDLQRQVTQLLRAMIDAALT